jgi:hypothetical protein
LKFQLGLWLRLTNITSFIDKPYAGQKQVPAGGWLYAHTIVHAVLAIVLAFLGLYFMLHVGYLMYIKQICSSLILDINYLFS